MKTLLQTELPLEGARQRRAGATKADQSPDSFPGPLRKVRGFRWACSSATTPHTGPSSEEVTEPHPALLTFEQEAVVVAMAAY